MAWDIHQLFLPETGWLRLPQPPAGSDIENPSTCSNSVRVGGKCNLAGTANYAIFGIMMKECYDYYSGSPALWTWKANIPFSTAKEEMSLGKGFFIFPRYHENNMYDLFMIGNNLFKDNTINISNKNCLRTKYEI